MQPSPSIIRDFGSLQDDDGCHSELRRLPLLSPLLECRPSLQQARNQVCRKYGGSVQGPMLCRRSALLKIWSAAHAWLGTLTGLLTVEYVADGCGAAHIGLELFSGASCGNLQSECEGGLSPAIPAQVTHRHRLPDTWAVLTTTQETHSRPTDQGLLGLTIIPGKLGKASK